MKLDLFNDLIKGVKESGFIQEFINELGNHLKNEISNKTQIKNDFTNIDQMIEKYNLNQASSRELREQRDEILQQYEKNLNEEESIYYVTYKNKENYTLTEYNKDGKKDDIYISEQDLPNNIGEGIILKKENGKYIIDEQTTKIIMDKISEIAEKISNEQNEKLNNLREEDGLYQVVDLSKNGVFLRNMDNNMTFEETNIPKELENKIANDYILRYKDGTYIFEKELTDKFLM